MPQNWNAAPKDPDAIRDYGMDWSADIGDATIASSQWYIDEGTVTNVQASYTDTTTTIRVSGGTDGEIAKLRNHVVLSNGEEDEFTGLLTIAER